MPHVDIREVLNPTEEDKTNILTIINIGKYSLEICQDTWTVTNIVVNDSEIHESNFHAVNRHTFINVTMNSTEISDDSKQFVVKIINLAMDYLKLQ